MCPFSLISSLASLLNLFTCSLFHFFTSSLFHFFTSSLLYFFTSSLFRRNHELSILGNSNSRLRLGDRHHRHLPRHDLAICRGWRPLSADGRAQGLADAEGQAAHRLAQPARQPLEVFPYPHRRLRHDFRRGHLVRHWPH